jgi:hypothetical protein
MISFCSKTHHCFRVYNKRSTKSLSKRQKNLGRDTFDKVLDTEQAQGGKNESFKTDGTTVYTYEQHGASLSFLYIKRQVAPDKVSTLPLSL